MSIKIKWNCSKPFFSVSVLSFTISTYDLQSFNLQRGNAGVRKTCAQANRSQYPPPSARETMLLGEYWQVQVSPRVSATVELCSAKRLLYAIGGWSWAITRTLRHRIAIRKYQTDMWRGRQCFWVKLLLRIKANDTIGSNISLSRNFHGLVVDQYTRHGSASSRAHNPHHLQQSRAYRRLLSDIIWRVLCSYIIPNKLHN